MRKEQLSSSILFQDKDLLDLLTTVASDKSKEDQITTLSTVLVEAELIANEIRRLTDDNQAVSVSNLSPLNGKTEKDLNSDYLYKLIMLLWISTILTLPAFSELSEKTAQELLNHIVSLKHLDVNTLQNGIQLVLHALFGAGLGHLISRGDLHVELEGSERGVISGYTPNKYRPISQKRSLTSFGFPEEEGVPRSVRNHDALYSHRSRQGVMDRPLSAELIKFLEKEIRDFRRFNKVRFTRTSAMLKEKVDKFIAAYEDQITPEQKKVLIQQYKPYQWTTIAENINSLYEIYEKYIAQLEETRDKMKDILLEIQHGRTLDIGHVETVKREFLERGAFAKTLMKMTPSGDNLDSISEFVVIPDSLDQMRGPLEFMKHIERSLEDTVQASTVLANSEDSQNSPSSSQFYPASRKAVVHNT